MTLTWIPYIPDSENNHPPKIYDEKQIQKTFLTFHGYAEHTRTPCLCFNAWIPVELRRDALGRPLPSDRWKWLTDGVLLYAEIRLPY